MKASDIMSTKVATVTEDTPITELANLMLEKHISGMPVVDANNKVVGMVSEGDLIRRQELGTERRRSKWISLFVAPEQKAREFVKSHGLHAKDVMSQPVLQVHEDATITEIADLMTQGRVKRLPVVRHGEVVGIVSRADLLRAFAARVSHEPPPPPESDTEIRDSVTRILHEEDWAKSAIVNVIVTDGQVQLWGVVDGEDQRKALTVAVEAIPGVKGIDDHLTHSLPT